MTFTEEQVEWIVMEVVRRLELLCASAEGHTTATAKGIGTPPSNLELSISDRVVTLRTIEGRLAGMRRLVVMPRAVVTPAVKDELRARNIELAVHGG